MPTSPEPVPNPSPRSLALGWRFGLLAAIALGGGSAAFVNGLLSQVPEVGWETLLGGGLLLGLGGWAIARWLHHQQHYCQQVAVAAQAADAQFEAAFEQSPIGMALRDLQGRYVRINPAFAAQLGYSRDEILGLSYRELSHPDDIFPESWLEPLLAGTIPSFTIEKRYLHKQGSIVWVQIYISVVRNEQDQPLYLLSQVLDITERRHYETTLQESKARNQAMLAAIPDLLFRISREGRYLSYAAHTSVPDLLGNNQSPVGQRLADLAPPEVAQRKLYYLDQALTTGETQVFEQSHWLNGRWQHEEVRVAPSGPDEALFLIRDITERKQSELTLRRYERMVSATTDGMVLLDRELRYRLVNQVYLDWHGWTAENTLGWAAAEKLDRERFETTARPRLEQALAGETVALSQWVDQEKAGRRFVNWTYAPYRELDGSITGVVVTLRDLTALKQAEQALAEREALFRGAFDEAPIGLTISSCQGEDICLVQANAAFYKIFGYTPEDFPALTAQQLTHPEDWPQDRALFQQLLAGDFEHYQLEKRCRHQQGSWVWCSLSVSLIRDAAGVPRYSLAHIQDISDRRAAEQAIRDLSESLEQRVRERTAALEAANQALEEARQAAEAAAQAKSRFLATMSHELRTPLNGILGYAQLLLHDDHLRKQQQHYVRIIYDCGERLLELIDDVLRLTKMEAQRLQLHPRPVALSPCLCSVVEIMRLAAETKGLTLHYEAAADLPASIWVDDRQVRQVLLNLLSNAIQFTQQGSVTLRVQTLASDRPDYCCLRFAIADTGSGIPPEDQARLFQPFEQGGSPQQQHTGVGLGLAISQELLQLMGSRLQLESEPGVGSCFWFDLTLLRETGCPPLLEPAPNSHARHLLGLRGPGPTVLIATENPEDGIFMSNTLAILGFRVHLAQDSRDCVAQASRDQPDLILIDAFLPTEDGQPVIQHLRQADATGRIEILGLVAAGDRDRALAAGYREVVCKPLQLQPLLTSIQTLMGSAFQLTDPASRSPASLLDQPLVAPALDDLENLYTLARKGDISGLQTYAKALKQNQPQTAAFADTLLTLTYDFRDREIQDLIQQYRSPHL